MSYLTLQVLQKFSYQLLVEVSLVTMPPNRTMESFFIAVSKRSCKHIENETVASKGGSWGGGGDKNVAGGGGLIKMESQILVSAPPLFISLRRCCYGNIATITL